jgi:hypothetical protein
MLQNKIVELALDRGNVATFVLATLVTGMSAAMLLLLYLPLR